jgi:hypothetical protein
MSARALAVLAWLAPLRRLYKAEEVLELDAVVVDVAVHEVDEYPEKDGAEEAGEDNGDDEVCVCHLVGQHRIQIEADKGKREKGGNGKEMQARVCI